MKKKLLLIATVAILCIASCKTQKIFTNGEADLNKDIHVTWMDREVLISNNSNVTSYEVECMGTKPYYSLRSPVKLLPGARWQCVIPEDIVKAVVKTKLPGGKILMVTLVKQKQSKKQTKPVPEGN